MLFVTNWHIPFCVIFLPFVYVFCVCLRYVAQSKFGWGKSTLFIPYPHIIQFKSHQCKIIFVFFFHGKENCLFACCACSMLVPQIYYIEFSCISIYNRIIATIMQIATYLLHYFGIFHKPFRII